MTEPLSLDIRERAMTRFDAGETVREIAEALSVAPSSVVKWSLRRRITGSVAPGRIGGHEQRIVRDEQAEWLRARMAAGAFTLRGLVAELAERRLQFRPASTPSGLSLLMKAGPGPTWPPCAAGRGAVSA